MKILSIAVPAYNVEKYIERCLSTFVDNKILNELEVIVINDGSIDRTEDIVNKFVRLYPNTFKLITKENGGHGSAVNVGIKHATGKYFRVVDGDDWVDTKELIKCINQLKETDTDMVSMHYHRVDMSTGEITAVEEKNIEYERIYLFEELKIEDRYFTLASTCFKTELLKYLDLKFQEKTYFVDVEYIIMPIINIRTIMFLDLYVYKYFVGNVEQSINIDNMVKRYKHHERVIKSCIEFIELNEIEKIHKKYIYNILKKVIYTHYSILLIYNLDKEKGQSLALEFDNYLKNSNLELYNDFYKEFRSMSRLRKYNFNYIKYDKAFVSRLIRRLERLKSLVKRYINVLKKIKRLFKYIIIRRI